MCAKEYYIIVIVAHKLKFVYNCLLFPQSICITCNQHVLKFYVLHCLDKKQQLDNTWDLKSTISLLK